MRITCVISNALATMLNAKIQSFFMTEKIKFRYGNLNIACGSGVFLISLKFLSIMDNITRQSGIKLSINIDFNTID